MRISISSKITEHFQTVKLPFLRLFEVTAKYNYSSSKYKDQYRNRKNVIGYSNMLIYDIDEKLNLDDGKSIFSDLGCTGLITTSRSHQKDKKGVICDRFRLFFLFDKDMQFENYDTYSIFYMYFATLIGLVDYIDTACVDASRFYYPNPKQEHFYFLEGQVFRFQTLYKNFVQWNKMQDEEKIERKKSTVNAGGQCLPYKNQTSYFTLKKNELSKDHMFELKGGEIRSFSDFEYLSVDETVLVRCPAPHHEDHKPSAFVGRSRSSGNLLAYCHKCSESWFMGNV